MNIRQGRLDDVETIGNFLALCWQSAFKDVFDEDYLKGISGQRWFDFLKLFIKENKGCILMGEVSGKIVANGILVSNDSVGEVLSFYVHPDYWRQGLGQLLMKGCFKWFKGQNIKSVELWVLESNKRACSFYEKEGFMETEHKMVRNEEGYELPHIKYQWMNGEK